MPEFFEFLEHDTVSFCVLFLCDVEHDNAWCTPPRTHEPSMQWICTYLYVYVCICMYVCMYVNICIYTHRRGGSGACVFETHHDQWFCICMFRVVLCGFMCQLVSISLSLHIYIYIYIYIYIINTYIYTYIQIYTLQPSRVTPQVRVQPLSDCRFVCYNTLHCI